MIHLPYTDDAGQHAAGLSIQPRSNSHLRSLYTKNIIDSELFSRGCVFQEWLLSPRIAAFSLRTRACDSSLPHSSLLNIKVQAEQHWQGAPDKSYKSALDVSLVQNSDVGKNR